MNQSSEIQEFKKYKPLLYITPNNKSSLQQSLSSAITTVTTEQDKNKLNSFKSNPLSIKEALIYGGLSALLPPFSYLLIPVVTGIFARQQNTQDSEQAKLDENTKLALNEFNLAMLVRIYYRNSLLRYTRIF
ncbi:MULTISPECIES: hypothetical protein [Okeania]|uniref:Uncharacterized protein n=1 Tax=Okeania hirsuta TaxID=1458930 RepID=A0A3N6NSS3_9CYAN|nr:MULTISPECIES: hypothetical protein [Okeania]NET13180.1 hypothetical protein [Okeania sp. SIO1H6]NES75281.1 hypothetical protein [Okeania sp. SIO1H4]NET19180.1 hypothetical protein [Okeania sp. SIO1H5]NET74960.1 hypothetical protein [Okeania sp. SIO1F9]NET93548.1 hypothetical protein [Okeania sp. SIO1H2]